MNDSGKWMYYENGKPVTGKKGIKLWTNLAKAGDAKPKA